MLVKKRSHIYSSQRKYVQGMGFVDSLSSTLRSVGSYVSQNRDLIAKPVLGAIGNLAAAGLTEGTKALLNHIINKKQKPMVNNLTNSQLDPKALQILNNIMAQETSPIPAVTNIIGSGIKRF